MEIRPVDVHDEDLFQSFFEIMRAAELFERPGMPMWSYHEAAVHYRTPQPEEEVHPFAAFEGATMLGIATMSLPVNDNTDKVYAQVDVVPEQRRRGIGSALVDHIVGQTRAINRAIVLGESTFDMSQRETHPYRRFAEKHGFALASVEINRALALPVADDFIKRWSDEAAPHHLDYRIETFDDAIPDELLESFCYLLNQLVVDAPTGDIDFEAQSTSPESLRIFEETLKKQGRTVYSTVAIDRSGEAVAHSELVVPPGDPGNVYQWGTFVRRDSRGHRLGLAVKARNLQVMQAAHPDRRRIFTCNSEVNGPMVAINELMGFEPVDLLAEFQLKLDV